jgi:IS5 family transposase
VGETVWADRAALSQAGQRTTAERSGKECAPGARDFTQRRCRYKGQIVDEVAWAKNRSKSKVRAKVEHLFQVMKLKFGFVKVRYRGLKKNAHRLFVTCALVNLFMSRRKLLAVV